MCCIVCIFSYICYAMYVVIVVVMKRCCTIILWLSRLSFFFAKFTEPIFFTDVQTAAEKFDFKRLNNPEGGGGAGKIFFSSATFFV